MKCLIDFGNSRCKWALQKTGNPLSTDTYRYSSSNTQERVNEVLNVISFKDCSEIHIVSVLGKDFEQYFKEALSKVTSIDPVFHIVEIDNHGIKLSYSDPSTYGVDRYAAIIAAYHSSQRSTIVIDCGTAITVDAVDKSGNHLGGLIMPGAGLMRSLLVNNAAMIPELEHDHPVKLLNHTTQDALHSGTVLTLRFGLQAIIQDIQDQMAGDAEVYVAGGEIALLGLKDLDCIHRPNLVLEGLEIMLG